MKYRYSTFIIKSFSGFTDVMRCNEKLKVFYAEN